MKALDDAEVSLSMNPGWVKGLFRKGRALAGLKVSGRHSAASKDNTGFCSMKTLSFLPLEVRRSRESLQAGSRSGQFPGGCLAGADARSDSASHGVCQTCFLLNKQSSYERSITHSVLSGLRVLSGAERACAGCSEVSQKGPALPGEPQPPHR